MSSYKNNKINGVANENIVAISVILGITLMFLLSIVIFSIGFENLIIKTTNEQLSGFLTVLYFEGLYSLTNLIPVSIATMGFIFNVYKRDKYKLQTHEDINSKILGGFLLIFILFPIFIRIIMFFREIFDYFQTKGSFTFSDTFWIFTNIFILILFFSLIANLIYIIITNKPINLNKQYVFLGIVAIFVILLKIILSSTNFAMYEFKIINFMQFFYLIEISLLLLDNILGEIILVVLSAILIIFVLTLLIFMFFNEIFGSTVLLGIFVYTITYMLSLIFILVCGILVFIKTLNRLYS